MTRIAIDIDGTLSNSVAYWKKIARKEGVTERFDDTYNGIYKVRCSDGEILANKLFGHYRDTWIAGAEAFPEVPQFIERINRNDKIKWWVVTSRSSDVSEQTLAWLASRNITGFEDVLFLQNKLKAPTQVLVDDKYEHVKSYSDNARMGFLLSRNYNLQHKVHRRVDNLLQVYDQILPYL